MHCPKTISMNWEDMEPISKYPVHAYNVKVDAKYFVLYL